MSKEPIDYHFKAVTKTEYELYLHIKAPGHLVNKLLRKSVKKAQKELRKRGNETVLDPDEIMQDIEVREIPSTYYRFLETSLRSTYKRVRRIIVEDDVKMVTHDVKKAYFQNKGKYWNITVVSGGIYLQGVGKD